MFTCTSKPRDELGALSALETKLVDTHENGQSRRQQAQATNMAERERSYGNYNPPVGEGVAKIQASHEGEHHGDFGDGPSFQINRATYIFVLCAALNSCNLGYDMGVTPDAAELIQEEWDLTNIQRELFVGSINFWAIFGALLAHFFTDGYGRRFTFLVAAVGFIIGLFIMAMSSSYGLLLFGRTFVGLGVGIGLAIDPLYIAELSPAKHRGRLVTYSEIALNVGIVLGFSSGLVLAPMSDGKEWRVMFLSGAIMPVVMIVLVFTIMPESPRWLVSKNRPEEAREILQKVYPQGWNVDLIIDDINEALEREQAAERAVGWKVLLNPTPAFRRMLFVGIGTAVAQQAVGIDAIQYYLLDVIEETGINSATRKSVVLILLGMMKLLFIVVGGVLFDRKGRRPLFFISLLGMSGALLLISLCFFADASLSSNAIIVGLAIYLSFFSVGMGPGAWLVPSEVFSLSIRGKAMSVATLLNRVTATLMSSTFLSTVGSIGWGGFFLMLSIICLIVFAFLYFYLPETKGRSLEDMSVYFAEITGDTSILEAEARIRLHQKPSGTIEMSQGSSPTTARHCNEVI
jgi:sugar porter (SP) family MFS transporter